MSIYGTFSHHVFLSFLLFMLAADEIDTKSAYLRYFAQKELFVEWDIPISLNISSARDKKG